MYKGNMYNTPAPSLGFISNHIRNIPGKKEINKEHSWNIMVNKQLNLYFFIKRILLVKFFFIAPVCLCITKAHRAKPIPLCRAGVYSRRLFGASYSSRREQAPALRCIPIITQIGRESKSDIPTLSEWYCRKQQWYESLRLSWYFIRHKSSQRSRSERRIPLGESRISLQSNRTRQRRIKLRNFLMRSCAKRGFFITL